MRVLINGEATQLPAGSRVSEVPRIIGLDDERGIAIAVDLKVIPKSEWDIEELVDGQSVEVLRAVQGG